MGLLNWLKNLRLVFSRKEKDEKLLKIVEDLMERIEKEIDNLADKALQTPGEYKINADGSRSTIKPSLCYRIEAEKLLPGLLDGLFLSCPGEISENEKRIIKKLVVSKAIEMRRNEKELGLCSVDVLDVPDKVRRKVKHILDVKFQSRVDLWALHEACKMVGLDCAGLKVSLGGIEDFLNKERIGKILIVYHDHAIRFRGFDKDGNIRGVSGNDNGAIRRILVSPSKIVDEEGDVILFLRREVKDKHPLKDIGRKLSDRELSNININVDEALAVMFPSKPKDTEEPDPARAWYLKGRELYDGPGQYEEAIAAFDKAIELDSKHSGAWDYKERCLLSLERYEEALIVIDKIIGMNSYVFPEEWCEKGKILENLQRHKEALDAYDKALELNPDYDLARDKRNKLFWRVEMREGGIITFKVALEKIDKLAGELRDTRSQSAILTQKA